MDVVTYTDARQNLKGVMDRVVEDKTPILVTRQKAEAVVMVSLSDWNAIAETLHLLSSTANAERLRVGLREFETGGGQAHELLDP